MPLEIERKFLVSGDFRPFVTESSRIVQGYLCSSSGKTVRIRIRGEKGFLTIRGLGSVRMNCLQHLCAQDIWALPDGGIALSER